MKPNYSSQIQILRSQSLVSAVQQEIYTMLLQGQFEMGQKLSEAALASSLGVSRGPVREAFRALEEAGLVTISKNRGVFVREFTPKDVRDLYDIRMGLDEMTGRLLAPRITNEQVAELEAMVQTMQQMLDRDDLTNYFPQNIEFHDRIVRMTGNDKLVGLYRRLTDEMHLMRRRSIAQGGGTLISNEEHRDIVAALATRDPETAARAMRAHGAGGYRRLLLATREFAEQPGRAASVAES
ncbi:MAG: FCD domain-containing protein [Burkholderiales bacterium]|nr:FCD domain-containing protein [Burkholderiales bacterium]ODU67018.1 MAG: hypothetical protein ABT05_04460 [Lautropia sp. SCN 66-9]